MDFNNGETPVNPLYLPERQLVRRKTAEWEHAMHLARAQRRMAQFRRRIRWARRRATMRCWWEVYGPFFGFLGHLAMWSFIALVFTALIVGFRR